MSDLGITFLLIAALFLILGSGVWIGLALSGVAWVGMSLFSARPAGDAMASTIVPAAIASCGIHNGVASLPVDMSWKAYDCQARRAL